MINADGEQLGVIPTDEARRIAKEQDLDLVEVNPSLDTAQITCLLAAQLVVEVIGFTHP